MLKRIRCKSFFFENKYIKVFCFNYCGILKVLLDCRWFSKAEIKFCYIRTVFALKYLPALKPDVLIALWVEFVSQNLSVCTPGTCNTTFCCFCSICTILLELIPNIVHHTAKTTKKHRNVNKQDYLPLQ